MTLAALDALGPACLHGASRPPALPVAGRLPEPTEEVWAAIEARLRAADLPEPEDNRALARMLGASFLLGLTLMGLTLCGLGGLLA